MLPAYRTGDIVLGVATYVADYSIGDTVVWYATYTHGVIHRVINASDGYVVTKGDNNPCPIRQSRGAGSDMSLCSAFLGKYGSP